MRLCFEKKSGNFCKSQSGGKNKIGFSPSEISYASFWKDFFRESGFRSKGNRFGKIHSSLSKGSQPFSGIYSGTARGNDRRGYRWRKRRREPLSQLIFYLPAILKPGLISLREYFVASLASSFYFFLLFFCLAALYGVALVFRWSLFFEALA